MSELVQGSLLDELAGATPRLAPLGDARRVDLSFGAWVDWLPGFLLGAAALFDRLVDVVPWHAERRQMYERVVDVPRLVKFYGAGDGLPDPLLADLRAALSTRYAPELGEPLATVGLCYYRDGRDSVAWHGDRIGRGRDTDTVVAILSLGSPRRFLLRPRGGGRSLAFTPGPGDLLVMGGSAQRTHDHCVPKTARPAGPRVSVQFRPRGVR